MLVLLAGWAAPLRAQAPAHPEPAGMRRVPASLPHVAARRGASSPVTGVAMRADGPSLAGHLRTGATIGVLAGAIVGAYAAKRESDRCDQSCGAGSELIALFYPVGGMTVGGIAGLLGGGVVYLVRRY